MKLKIYIKYDLPPQFELVVVVVEIWAVSSVEGHESERGMEIESASYELAELMKRKKGY